MQNQHTQAWRAAVETAYREKARRGFLTHLAFYLVFNTFFIALNLKTSPDILWFLFPLIFWGIFVVFHGVRAVGLVAHSARAFFGEVLAHLEEGS